MFHYIMDNVEELRDYIQMYQYVSKEQFLTFVREQEQKQQYGRDHGVAISETTVQYLFEILDIDGNGIIDQ